MMKSKYILPLIIFSLLSVFQSNAENNSLYLQLHSGAHVLFPLSEEPKIEFDEGDVFISTSQFEFQDIAKYTFVDFLNIPESLTEVQTENYPLFYSDYIVLPASCPSSEVALYTVSGIQMMCPISKSEEQWIMNISSLPANVYVLYICNKAIKFVRR